MKATGWYDNSTKNPANPDATKTVCWGPQTTDEMMVGYLENFVLAGSTETMGSGFGGRFDTATLFKRVDANGDGKISRAEYDAFVKLLPRFENNPDEARRRPDASLCDSTLTAMVLSRWNFKSSVPPAEQCIERAKRGQHWPFTFNVAAV